LRVDHSSSHAVAAEPFVHPLPSLRPDRQRALVEKGEVHHGLLPRPQEVFQKPSPPMRITASRNGSPSMSCTINARKMFSDVKSPLRPLRPPWESFCRSRSTKSRIWGFLSST